MAYKRKTTKTGPKSRSSTTYNTNGPSTYSNSTTHAGTTITRTSKGGKYHTTQTIRRPDGTVERKRIQNSAKSSNQTGDGFGTVLLLVVVGTILSFLFG
jgi:hypothetical protein